MHSGQTKTLALAAERIADLEARFEAAQALPSEAPERLRLALELGWALALSDSERARALTEDAEVLSLAHEFSEGIACALRNRAYFRMMEGDLVGSMTMAKESKGRFEAIGHRRGICHVEGMFAHLHRAVGDLTRALKAGLTSLRLAREVEDQTAEASALLGVGWTEFETGDFDGSKSRILAALKMYEAMGQPEIQSLTHRRLGELEAHNGRYEAALKHYETSLRLADSQGMALWVAMAQLEIGKVYEQLDQPERAEQHYQIALKNRSTETEGFAAGELKARLAEHCIRRGEIERAHPLLEQADRIAERAGAKPLQLRIADGYSRFYEAQGDFARALEFARSATELREHALNARRSTELKKLQARAELERAEKDAEIHRLKYIELKRMQDQLVAAEKMALLGELAAGVAHEVNSPLSAIVANLDVLERALSTVQSQQDPRKLERANNAARSAVRSTQSGVTRIRALVQSLSRFSGLDEAPYRKVNLTDSLKSTLTLLEPKTPEGVTVRCNLEPLPELLCTPTPLNQVFMTLLLNAVESIESPPGEVTLRARTVNTDREAHPFIEVQVEDTGKGIPPAQAASLFEIGFSQQRERMGLRLGLPSAASIIHQHQGTISVDSVVGEGSCFTIRIPVLAG